LQYNIPFREFERSLNLKFLTDLNTRHATHNTDAISTYKFPGVIERIRWGNCASPIED
jgi:hypothetical protein